MTTVAQDHTHWTGTVLHRWPTMLGLLAAGLALATAPSRESAAITLGVALLCYLGAAALNRPWLAWAGVPAGSLVVVAGELAGLTWWAAIGGVAAALVATGLALGVPRPALTAQTAALLGFGAVAVLAVVLAPRVGMVVAGLALASHVGWDVVHYRRDRVVPRSLAEFCMFLDVPLGLGLVVLAFVEGP